MISWFDFILIVLAACFAGFVNAVAGGGTLITFPVLTALGIPPVVANITNTLALCPGYFSAAFVRFNDLKRNRKLLSLLIPIGAVGGIVGGVLLLTTEEKQFRSMVPFLILLASCLLALQDIIKTRLIRINKKKGKISISVSAILFFSAIYGGYFGAGLGIILLATLGFYLDDSLTELVTLKQILAFTINTSAAIFFMFSGKVLWPVAIVMIIGSLIGGAIGGRFAGNINPVLLRWIVVAIGLIVSCIYFVK